MSHARNSGHARTAGAARADGTSQAIARKTPTSESWLGSLVNDGPPDIAVLWELCLRFEYDRAELISGLTQWLGEPAGQRVLDCACGTGFPAIELARSGYDMTCSDGSTLMLGYFKRRADLEGVTVQAHQVRWEELAGHYDERFDVVMCRGCALPYAGTWDDDLPPDRDALIASVRQFAASLRPGGRLYVDTAAGPPPAGPELCTHAPFMVGQHAIELTEQLRVDHKRNLRYWHSQLTINGRGYEFERRSHYLPPEALMRLLVDAGLCDVRREVVPGEHYAVVTATRGAG